MPEDIPNTQQATDPTPAPESKPSGSEAEPEPAPKKKRGRFFKKIPKEFLISPGGVILVFIAVIFEITDIFIPGGSLTLEIIPDLIFALFLAWIAKVPFSNSIIPFLIERIPVISDILPTWLIRMFI